MKLLLSFLLLICSSSQAHFSNDLVYWTYPSYGDGDDDWNTDDGDGDEWEEGEPGDDDNGERQGENRLM